MSDPHNTRKEEYQRAFSAFDDLKLEEKAFFLVDAAMTTVARALESAGRALSRELDHLAQVVVQTEEAVKDEVEDEVAEAAAEASAAAEAAAEAAPPPKKKTTTRKKTTAKKTNAKKTTTPRTRTSKPKPDPDA